jgi:predicted metalloprotease
LRNNPSGRSYCPVDRTAYFDTGFLKVLFDQFGSSGGPLAQEYVVAHEHRHHLQNLLGDSRAAQAVHHRLPKRPPSTVRHDTYHATNLG